jgi:hypothetical protein
MLCEAIFGQIRKEVRPVIKTKIRERTNKQITIKALKNPAADCQLGWRRDA